MIENDQSRTRGREEERPWKRGWEPIGDLSPRLILSDLTGLPLLSGSRCFRVARKLPGNVVWGPPLETLTLSQSKICVFPHPSYFTLGARGLSCAV